jgi:hypothetical protein
MTKNFRQSLRQFGIDVFGNHLTCAKAIQNDLRWVQSIVRRGVLQLDHFANTSM